MSWLEPDPLSLRIDLLEGGLVPIPEVDHCGLAPLRILLPLYDQQNHFLLRNDVEGVRTLAVSTPTFAEAWLDR